MDKKDSLLEKYDSVMKMNSTQLQEWISSPDTVIEVINSMINEYLFHKAIDLSDRILLIKPQYYLGHLVLGGTYTKKGLFEETRRFGCLRESFKNALVHLQEAEKLSCPVNKLYPDIIISMLRNGEVDNARKRIKYLKNNNIDYYKQSRKWYLSYLYRSAALELERYDPEEDENCVGVNIPDDIVQDNINPVGHCYVIACILFYTKKAVEINPEDCVTYYYCNTELRRIGNLSTLNKQWIDLEPTNPYPYYFLGNIYLVSKYLISVKYFEKAKQLFIAIPNRKDEIVECAGKMYLALGLDSCSTGLYDMAKDQLKKSINIFKHNKALEEYERETIVWYNIIILDEKIKYLSRCKSLKQLYDYINNYCIKYIHFILKNKHTFTDTVLDYSDISDIKAYYVLIIYMILTERCDIQYNKQITSYLQKNEGIKNKRDYILRLASASRLMYHAVVDKIYFLHHLEYVHLRIKKKCTIYPRIAAICTWLCDEMISNIRDDSRFKEIVEPVKALKIFVSCLDENGDKNTAKEKHLMNILYRGINNIGCEYTDQAFRDGMILKGLDELKQQGAAAKSSIDMVPEKTAQVLKDNDLVFKQDRLNICKGKQLKTSEYKLIFKTLYGKPRLLINGKDTKIQELQFARIFYLAAVRIKEKDRWINKCDELYFPRNKQDIEQLTRKLSVYPGIIESSEERTGEIRLFENIKKNQIIIDKSINKYTPKHWKYAMGKANTYINWEKSHMNITLSIGEKIKAHEECVLFQKGKKGGIVPNNEVMTVIKSTRMIIEGLKHIGKRPQSKVMYNKLRVLEKHMQHALDYFDQGQISSWLHGEVEK